MFNAILAAKFKYIYGSEKEHGDTYKSNKNYPTMTLLLPKSVKFRLSKLALF